MAISTPQSEVVDDGTDRALTEGQIAPKRPRDEAAIEAQAAEKRSREALQKGEDAAKMLAIKAGLGLPDAVKQKFLEPFTTEEKTELVRVFRESRDNPEAVQLFERHIGGNINFVAYKAEARYGGEIFFRVMDGNEVKAQINFRPKKGDVLDMVHREVQSQTLGISGSSLLVKIEEYFKVLEEAKLLSSETTLAVEAGQVSVAQWALKNGYKFKNQEEEQLFQAIASGQKRDEYIVTDVGDGKLFDSYIFKRDIYESHKSEMNEDPTLAKKYSVRFVLVKRLTTDMKTKDIPQPSESTGKAPLIDGVDGKLLRSENLSLEEIFASSEIDQASIPYYRDVYDDVQKGDFSWGVTKKVKEYADYLAKNPGSLAGLPPVQFLNDKLHDGAHRISALYLLSKLYPDSIWPTVKLKVDFYEEKIKE